jgi:hypothetical protein
MDMTTDKQKRIIPRPERPNQKHGGESGIKALATDTEFTAPLAVGAQEAVRDELETNGLESIVERAAVRLQAVSDLFYDAIQAAAQSNDLEKIDMYSQRFGWLQSKALIAWGQVKTNRKQGKPALMGVLADYDNQPSE